MSASPARLDRFHPSVRTWFAERLGTPTPPQVLGWPAISTGEHVLIAAPTGTGKTLAAFLWALDGLLCRGADLPDATEVLYVSPLRALSNDVRLNLEQPLAELRERDPSLPEIRVSVRTGDTTPSERAKMMRKPPHVLVTTPESLYILLTSDGGRGMLRTVRTVIVDEIHALSRDKRGSHLALSLERLESLVADSQRVRECVTPSLFQRDGDDEIPSAPEVVQLAPVRATSTAGGMAPGRPWLQRIGLSATQKPLEQVARLLVGPERACTLVDVGHQRAMDVDVLVPESPLSAVCSHEQWGELYARMAEMILEHRTTLLFVGTRKLAERLAARLEEVVGEGLVGCHHGSLAKETRHEAEVKLKAGEYRALVATASLELGIDIGDIDLVFQVGATRSIATLLQRVGRSGHAMGRTPKGRIVPLTLDEASEAVALMKAMRDGLLDRTPQPIGGKDILAQQIVAACVPEEWDAGELHALCRRSWPYRDLARETFDAAVDLHSEGRYSLLHRDGVAGRLLGTKRARMPSLTSGGAIPDTADYRVILEPEGTIVGTLNEDFAVEANVADIFQLGNASWRILKIEPGIVRVADAAGEPPTLPFWLGEAPARTEELSGLIGEMREEAVGVMVSTAGDHARLVATVAAMSAGELVRGGPEDPIEAAAQWMHAVSGACLEVTRQVALFIAEGYAVLGAVPTQKRVVGERFFDETGGMQLVIHAPFGGRINRAWGLALRKKFCRGFGFELQAAATEEAILISLGPHHSFPLADVFKFLHSKSARDTLVQASLQAPVFQTRWRWNVSRSLMLPRMQGGKRVPPALLRMRADDLLVKSFPAVMACGETLPAGDLPVPMDHPIVAQTVEDCLEEHMDVDGLIGLLTGLEDTTIEICTADVPEPSAFAHGILAAAPYSFLDDAPLEERRTQAVRTRRILDPGAADAIGALDPLAVERVRDEAWPRPRDFEEVHEVLLWMGFVSDAEADEHGWTEHLRRLESSGRAERDGERWFAREAPRGDVDVLRGRLEALGPVRTDHPEFAAQEVALATLEAEGVVLRTRIDGVEAWCNRRLLARIHRYTLDALRKQIEPVTAADYLRFLARWHCVEPGRQREGPLGVLETIQQLAGCEVPAAAWDAHLLPARVRGYRKSWLDELALGGHIVWGRLWGSGTGAMRTTPISLVPRTDVDTWLALAPPGDEWGLKANARAVFEVLGKRGACFATELERSAKLLPGQVDEGLTELVGLGLATADGFSGLRALFAARKSSGRRRRRPGYQGPSGAVAMTGRWTLLRRGTAVDDGETPDAEFIARRLLRRWGIVFRKVLERERMPIPWRDVLFVLRRLEARGDIRGGRFVAGFHGEQFALPEAVDAVRAARRRRLDAPLTVAASDPLNLVGILTPEERVPSNAPARVAVC